MRTILRHRHLLLVLVVLAPRMIWFLLLGGSLPTPVRDQAIYISAAGRMLQGEGLSFSREIGWLRSRMATEEVFSSSWTRDPGYVFGMVPTETPTASIEPGYPLLLASAIALTGPSTGGVFLLNCIFALVGAWAVLKLVEDNWGERQGMLAALIWSVYPFYIYYSAYAMTEMVHAAMLPLLMLLTSRAVSGRHYGLASGLATGFLFLVRSTAIFILPLQMAWLFWRKRWKQSLMVACGFIVCCVPWMVRNQAKLGSPVLLPTKGALNLWMRNNPRMLEIEGIGIPDFISEGLNRTELLDYPDMDGVSGELERSGMIGDRAREFILANPMLLAYLTLARGWSFLSPLGGTLDHPLAAMAGLLIYLPLLVISLMEFARRRKDPEVLLLACLFLVYLAVHSLAHGGVRYRLPVDMVLIVLFSLFAGRKLGWEPPSLPSKGEAS